MFRKLFFSLILITGVACEKPEDIKLADFSASTEAEDEISIVNDDIQLQKRSENHQQITESRKTGITRAVEKASPAIVSITVTEIVEGRGNIQFDPYYGFFLAPSQREFKGMGSGFIISNDGLVWS